MMVAACGGGDGGGGDTAASDCPESCSLCLDGMCADVDAGGGQDTSTDTATDEDTATGEDTDPEPDADAAIGCVTDDDCDAGSYCDEAAETCLVGCRLDPDTCAEGEACSEDRVCEAIEGYCNTQTPEPDCVDGQFCCPLDSFCGDDGRCASGCQMEDQCSDGQPCVGASDEAAGTCGCVEADDCGDGEQCAAGRCQPLRCEVDGAEPNDTPSEAELLPVRLDDPQEVSGLYMCNGEQDFYGLELEEGVQVEGRVEPTLSGPESLRWIWTDPNGRELGSGSQGDAFAFVAAGDGLHLLEVVADEGAVGSYTIDYTLSVEGPDCDPDGPPDGVVRRLGLMASLDLGAASMCAEQRDTYDVQLARPGQGVTAELTREDDAVGTEVALRMLDGDGAVLAEATGDTPTLSVAADELATTEITVEVAVAAGGTPEGIRYSLALTSRPGELEPCEDDDREPNNDREEASALPNAPLTSRVLCEEDSADWYSVTAMAGEAVQIDVLYEGQVAPVVRVTLPEGQVSQGEPGRCDEDRACVRVPALAAAEAGTWFVAVTAPFGDEARIEYDVVVERAGRCNPTPGLWAAGCACTPGSEDAPFSPENLGAALALPHNDNVDVIEPLTERTLCVDDAQDRFDIVVPGGSGLALELRATGGVGTARLELLADDGGVVRSVAAGERVQVSPLLEERRFGARVVRDGAGDMGYQLLGTLYGALADCVEDDFAGEPTPELGLDYGEWTLGRAVLCDEASESFDVVTLAQGDNLTVTVERDWGRTPLSVTLVANAGQDQAQVLDAQAGEGELTVSGGDLPAGRYRVVVEPMGQPPVIGDGYTLRANLSRGAGAECSPEFGEPNDSADDATPLVESVTLYGGVLCARDDARDVYSVNIAPQEGFEVRFEGRVGASVVLEGPEGADAVSVEPFTEGCGPGLACFRAAVLDADDAQAGTWTITVEAEDAFGDLPYRLGLDVWRLCDGPDWADGCVCTEDGREPSSTVDDALELVVEQLEDARIEGLTLCGGGEDWFRISGPIAAETLVLSFEQTRDGFLGLELFADPEGTESVFTGRASYAQRYPNVASRDALWMRVSTQGGQDMGYDLSVGAGLFATDPCPGDPFEPSDAVGQGEPQVLERARTVLFAQGRVCGPGEEDWYGVDYMGVEGAVAFGLTRTPVGALSNRPELGYRRDWIDEAALVVEVYDGELNLLASHFGAQERLDGNLSDLEPGRYWFRVRLLEPTRAQASPFYNLAITDVPQGCADRFEPNNSQELATALTFAGEADVLEVTDVTSCGSANDLDVYSVQVEPGDNLRVELGVANAATLEALLRGPGEVTVDFSADVVCAVYDTCLVAERTIDAAGTWWFEVSGAGVADVEYDITVSRGSE